MTMKTSNLDLSHVCELIDDDVNGDGGDENDADTDGDADDVDDVDMIEKVNASLM